MNGKCNVMSQATVCGRIVGKLLAGCPIHRQECLSRHQRATRNIALAQGKDDLTAGKVLGKLTCLSAHQTAALGHPVFVLRGTNRSEDFELQVC